LDTLLDRLALRTSQATFVIASRASWIDDVIDRSAAERKKKGFFFLIKEQRN
jgi:hypothetical protein